MAFQYVLPDAVTSQLDSLRRRVRRVAFLRGCGLFLTLSCGLLIATMLVDFLLDLEPSSRVVGFVGFCLSEITLSAYCLVRPWVIKLKDAEVASLAEERFPELGERVSSLVELSDPDIPEGEKGSPLMRDLLEEETVQELARCDFDEAVSTRPAIRRLGYGIGTLSFLVLSLLIFPSVSSLLLARLFKPWGNYESVSRLIFEIEGADEYVARGSDIEITAKMAWRNGTDEPIPEPVELLWKSDDGNSDVRSLSFDPDQDAFTTAIPNAQDSLEFFVASAGSRSRRYRINVLDRPEVLTAKLEITPPGYLGQPREMIDGITGEITVFEYSQLVFNLTFSHPVEEASIDWIAPMVLPESELAGEQQVLPVEGADDENAAVRRTGTHTNSLVAVDSLPATPLVVSEDGLSAKIELNAVTQGAFTFLLKESHGLQNAAEPHRQIAITRDQPPILELPGGNQDRAKPTDVYGIRVSAVDDVALEELELHVTSREGLDRIIKAPTELLGQESLEHEFRIDLADIAVKSGDFLKLQIRAVDGRPVPAPNEVWSEARYVAISDDASAQGTGDVLARQQQIKQELQDIRERLREAVEQSDDLKQDAQKSLDDNRQFAQQDAVKDLAGREEELAARIAGLADQFSQHPLFSNLSENLWEMAAEQLDPAAMQLAESNAQGLQKQVATLDENSAVADMVEEDLAEVAAKFDKLSELEKDLLELNRIAQRAKQLADDAQQLDQNRQELAADEARDRDPLDEPSVQKQQEARQKLADNQQLLMEEQSELMAALNNLMQQRPELLEAARDHQLEKLAELARQASRIAEPQELLAESLTNDAEKSRQAAAPLAERQQKIAQQVEELAAQANARQARQPVTPIDPELARRIADELQQGNLQQAARLSRQAQQKLAELAKELAGNAELPEDPKEAAAELAGQQQASASPTDEKLAAQAGQLAGLQQELQQAIAELAQQPASGEPAGEPSGEQVADAAGAQSAQQAGAEPGAAEPETTEPGARSPASNQIAGTPPEASSPATQQPGAEPASASVRELLAQQEELTAQAAQLALQTARQAGAESPVTQAATQSAQQSAQAETAARGGQFAQAANEASNAQQSASSTAEALQESAPALAEQAEQLAERQQQMAEAFQQLENSPAQRAAAQQTQQEQLAAQADTIAQALEELAGQLGAQPLDLQQPGQQAASAQQSAQQGQQAAGQAAQNMQAGNQGRAAQSAQQAAESMRQAAQQAAANATPSNQQSPVPGEFAAQITEAMRRLQQAQQQLAQATSEAASGNTSAGQPGTETGQSASDSGQPTTATLDAATGENAAQPAAGESSNGQPTPGQPSPSGSEGQPGEGQTSPDGGQPGESGQQSGQSTPGSSPSNSSNSSGGQRGEPAPSANNSLTDAADALQQAADMLSHAAQQLAADGAQSGDNAGQGNQAPSDQPPGLGNSGTGAFVAGDAQGPLDIELKRRAMKNWGKLPGSLKTEILQSSQRKANGDYAKLIKLYFEELAKAGQASEPEQ